MMRRFKLVDNARNAWRWVSMQAMTAAIAVQGAWMFIPADMKSSIPPNVVQYATLALLALGVVGRLVKQKEPTP